MTGSDAFICRVARSTSGAEKNKLPEDDRALIRYLFRHAHTTPVEFGEAVFFLRIQMDAWRQMVRHRTASINEYSTRYREAIDEAFTLRSDEWRLQSKANRQGSSGNVAEYKDSDLWPADWPLVPLKQHVSGVTIDGTGRANKKGQVISTNASITVGEFLSDRQEEVQELAREVYEERVNLGVAFEVARKDLPLSTYTELYWKCDLNNIFRFLSLRMHAHAQKEIREYAEAMYALLKPHFPMCFEAFDDFDTRRGGLLLSRLEVEMIQKMVGDRIANHYPTESTLAHCEPAQWAEFEQWQKDQGRKAVRVGERDEAKVKFRRLGLLPPMPG